MKQDFKFSKLHKQSLKDTGDWEEGNLKEHECIFCMRKSGQKTLNKNLPFRGHFICSVCFEKRHREDIIYG